MRPLSLSSHSSRPSGSNYLAVPLALHAHPPITSTIRYFNHPSYSSSSLLISKGWSWSSSSSSSSCCCGCRNISSAAPVCCRSTINEPPMGMGGYGEGEPPSYVFSPSPERSTTTHVRTNAIIKDHQLVIDAGAVGGVPNTTSFSALMRTCDHHHIEIRKFLSGKNYFITGATGFLAKVWLEKMLRSVPEVGKIFLLINAKDRETAKDRLKNEIIGPELFKCLKQKHGESYTDFMMSKLVPVVGNVCESNLGMDATSAAEIAEAVDVIVNSAANTVFDERYDVALNTNTKGPSRLLNFVKKCKKLSVFVHVSTAYVNGEREGVALEKPYCIGESIAGEKATSASASAFPVLDIAAEIELASRVMETCESTQVTRKMKDLGFERARMYGWQDTYTFTKAMGEMLINSKRSEIAVPVVIIRPTVIESTFREPFPGWIQGNRMLDPLILYYGKGQLPGLLCDPKAVIDVVPVDMVVNATMAATAKHGNGGKPEVHVYHVASSLANPLLFGDVFKFSCDHFNSSPLKDSKGKRIDISGMKYFSSMDKYSSYIGKQILQQAAGLMMMIDPSATATATTISDQKLHQMLEFKCQRKVERILHLAKIYQPYMFYRGLFDSKNTQNLMEGISEEEMKSFEFDVRDINWKYYILKSHIPGLRRHVLRAG